MASKEFHPAPRRTRSPPAQEGLRRPSAPFGLPFVEKHLCADHRRHQGPYARRRLHLEKDVKGALKTGADAAAAAAVGKLIAERASKAGVKEVVFDRGPYIYHGRVKALAEAAREGGLSF